MSRNPDMQGESMGYLASIIKTKIIRSKKSVSRIAEETGIPMSNIYRFLQGKNKLSTDSAETILKYFGCKISVDE